MSRPRGDWGGLQREVREMTGWPLRRSSVFQEVSVLLRLAGSSEALVGPRDICRFREGLLDERCAAVR